MTKAKTQAPKTTKAPKVVPVQAIRDILIEGAIKANAQYMLRSKKPNVDADGVQVDCGKGIKLIKELSDVQLTVMRDTLRVDFQRIADGFAQNGDVKNVLRVPSFMAFMASGDTGYLKASAKTALLAFAVACTGARNRAGVMQSLTGKAYGDGDAGYNNPAYERASKLVDLFGGGRASRMQKSTALRQLEVAAGPGGIFDSLGMMKPMTRAGLIDEIIDCPASRTLVALIESASDETMGLWAE